MEEIQSRLEIIRLAVDLGDQAAVNHQVTHLRNLTTDTDLHTILDELERHNFHQALFAMREYTARQEQGDAFFAPESSEPEPAPVSEPREDRSASSDSQELFGLEEPRSWGEGGERILSVDEMLAMTRESATPPRAYEPPPSDPAPVDTPVTEESTPEAPVRGSEEMALFDLGEDEELAVTPEPEVTASDPVSSLSTEPEAPARTERSEEVPSVDTPVAENGLFDLDDRIREAEGTSDDTSSELFAAEEEPSEPFHATAELFGSGVDVAVRPALTEEPTPWEEEPEEPASVQPSEQEDEEIFVASEAIATPEAAEPEPVSEGPTVPDEYEPAPDEPRYEAFAYMGQKFRNMLHQFPQKIPYEEGVYIEAQRFIDRVSTEDYTESQVEAMIARYQELKAEGHLAEAAQVLIAAATTESTFAQFMLARELFKGEVLKADHAEAFTQINRMAEEDYPEAICDLGQLYEHGIGIDKNKRHALLLYEEAAAMGIERARQHYERLRSTNPLRNLTSLFSRK